MTHRTEEQLDLFDCKFNVVVTDAEPAEKPEQESAPVAMQDFLTSAGNDFQPEPFFAIWVDSLPKKRKRRSLRKHSA